MVEPFEAQLRSFFIQQRSRDISGCGPSRHLLRLPNVAVGGAKRTWPRTYERAPWCGFGSGVRMTNLRQK